MTDDLRLLISGSRGWRDADAIEAIITAYLQIAAERGVRLVVIHGHCPDGADKLADQVARKHGLSVEAGTLIRVPADWGKYGKRAGHVRNHRMATEFEPDVLYAFRASGKSNGTDNMVGIAERLGIEHHVVT